MRNWTSGGVRFRQFVAGFAMVLVVAPGAAAQTPFEGGGQARPPSSRPFRVRFDTPATVTPIQTNLSRLAEASHADASTIQFRPPRRRYPGTPSSATKSAQKLTAAVALGVVGSFAGGLLGGVLTKGSGGESPGMTGFIIGAPIGGAIGALLGYRLVQ